MAQKGGPSYAQVPKLCRKYFLYFAINIQACAQLLHPLAASISRPNAKDTDEDMTATENSVSAVAKILKYNSSAVNPNEVVQ
jgi:hypothetical protein